jgi:hypothetical protein
MLQGRGDAGFLSLFFGGGFDTLEKSDLTLHRGLFQAL